MCLGFLSDLVKPCSRKARLGHAAATAIAAHMEQQKVVHSDTFALLSVFDRQARVHQEALREAEDMWRRLASSLKASGFASYHRSSSLAKGISASFAGEGRDSRCLRANDALLCLSYAGSQGKDRDRTVGMFVLAPDAQKCTDRVEQARSTAFGCYEYVSGFCKGLLAVACCLLLHLLGSR